MSSLSGLQTECFTGSFVDKTGAVHVLQRVGTAVTVTSGTAVVYGNASDNVLSMYGMTGELEDSCIFWSNGNVWAHQADQSSVSVPVRSAHDLWGESVLQTSNTKLLCNEPEIVTEGGFLTFEGVTPLTGVWVCASGELQRQLRNLFTIFCVLAFAFPVSLIVFITADMNTKFWITSDLDYRWCLLVFAIILLAHFVHWWLQSLNKVVVLLTFSGIATCLVFLTGCYMISVYQIDSELAEYGCFYPDKQMLQLDWDAAYQFYSSCTENKTMLITDCPNYATYLTKFPHWNYLSSLESEFLCSGWCLYEKPMWTTAKTEDPCSIVVGFDLNSKAFRILFEVTVYCFILLLFP